MHVLGYQHASPQRQAVFSRYGVRPLPCRVNKSTSSAVCPNPHPQASPLTTYISRQNSRYLHLGRQRTGDKLDRLERVIDWEEEAEDTEGEDGAPLRTKSCVRPLLLARRRHCHTSRNPLCQHRLIQCSEAIRMKAFWWRVHASTTRCTDLRGVASCWVG